MLKRHYFLLVIVLVFAFNADCFAQEEGKVKLHEQTLVVVKTTQRIDAEHFKAGSTVMLEVAVDVKVGDQVLIASGTPVLSVMVQAEAEGMIGKGGEMALSVNSTNAVDGTVIPLRGYWRVTGEASVGGTVAAGLILCPLFLLGSGEPAIILKGAQMRVFTIGEYKILPKLQNR